MLTVKASLHLHTHEDSEDCKQIAYTIYQLLDEAARQEFKVLALTGHRTFICRPEYIAYAKKLGILLLPGVELALFDRTDSFWARRNLGGKHCLVINCRADAEQIKTFADLAGYRRRHPEIIVIAAHPNHRMGVSMGLRRLKKYRALFDAAEHSWFYACGFNLNRAAARVCRQLDLPFIATADLHFLDLLSEDYAELTLNALTPAGVKEAIKAGRFKNFSRRKSLFRLLAVSLTLFGD